MYNSLAYQTIDDLAAYHASSTGRAGIDTATFSSTGRAGDHTAP